MKQYRSTLVISFLCLLTLTTVIYASCSKSQSASDPCKNINCINGGACNNGKCTCPTGFTGTYCETVVTPDPCAAVVCQNSGTCVNGTCSCVTGYEGTYCETMTRAKFIKTWNANDILTSNMSTVHYSTNIQAATGTDITVLNISMFSNFFTNLTTATVNGTTITIARQNPDADRYSVTGTGTFTTDSKIQWSYSIRNDSTGAVLNYTGIWQ